MSGVVILSSSESGTRKVSNFFWFDLIEVFGWVEIGLKGELVSSMVSIGECGELLGPSSSLIGSNRTLEFFPIEEFELLEELRVSSRWLY